MTRGRKGDKVYTGYNGVAESTLRAKDKLRHSEAGVGVHAAPPSQEAMRHFIEQQICPWCGSGPWKILAIHTNKAHGVSGDELRAHAGLFKTASVCDPDVSRDRADRARERDLAPLHAARPTRRREYSEAGKAVQRQKLARLREEVGADELARIGAAAASRATAERHAEQYAECERLFAEGRDLQSISDAVGLHPKTVGIALRRAGLDTGGVTAQRRRERMQSAEMRAASAAAQRANSEQTWARRAAEYREAGSDWAAIRAIAEREGLAPKSLRAGLVARGVDVPDGRGDHSIPKGRAAGRQYPDRKPCSVPGCDRLSVARLLCDPHYRQERKRDDDAL